MRSIVLIGALFFMVHVSFSQNVNKAELKDFFKPAPKTTYGSYLKTSSNELETTFTVLFLAYKTVLSSQDIESCVFYPSCSVYAVQCMQHHSVLLAPFQILDRLQRCHPFATPKQYNFNIATGKFYDPIDN